MGKRPKLEALDCLFEKGENFLLTDSQYEKKTGAALPKDKYYICKKSALAKKAAEKGYDIEVIEKQVKFIKKEEVKLA